MDRPNNKFRSSAPPFYPLMLPEGRMINLASIQTVDWLEVDHRVAIRGPGEAILAMVPASAFGGLWNDDPIRICRTIRGMVMSLHRGDHIDHPNWLADDGDF